MLENGTCVGGEQLMNKKFQIFSGEKNVIAAE